MADAASPSVADDGAPGRWRLSAAVLGVGAPQAKGCGGERFDVSNGSAAATATRHLHQTASGDDATGGARRNSSREVHRAPRRGGLRNRGCDSEVTNANSGWRGGRKAHRIRPRLQLMDFGRDAWQITIRRELDNWFTDSLHQSFFICETLALCLNVD